MLEKMVQNGIPEPPNPTIVSDSITMSPSPACDSDFAFESDLNYQLLEDPVLASLH